MKIIIVSGKKTVDKFYKVPRVIYRGDQNYTPMLRKMVENTFDPEVNARFNHGNACRWILEKNGQCIGRIAAFYDTEYSNGYEQPTGCFGFFECIDDQKAANMLFDTAREWLLENGMEAMDGPVNFGENFFNWGLLIDDYKPQAFGMQYNPSYYKKLFENYGLRIYYKQYSYSLDITNPYLPERFWKIAEWVAKKKEYSFEPFSFKKLDKFIYDFIEIHKKAWAKHGNYKPLDYDQLKGIVRQAGFFLEEDFIWFVYHEGEPIAFFMMIPDVNQVIRKLNSDKINWMNILKIIYYKRKNVISRCRVIVFGVIPQFQNMGIESGVFYRIRQVILQKKWYNDMEMSWVGDFNPKMNVLFKSLGAEKSFTHITMRYLFDREKEFKRAPIITE